MSACDYDCSFKGCDGRDLKNRVNELSKALAKAVARLDDNLPYLYGALSEHERDFGETTKKNWFTAERIRSDISQTAETMKEIMEALCS